MKKTILIVYAQPEPTSLTHHLVNVGIDGLQEQGHEVLTSDLYGMRWKAVFDADDFPSLVDERRLSFIDESRHAYKNGLQTADVAAEQKKLLAADAVILMFPLWWFSMPAIMKGWIERVYAYNFAYGYKDAGNAYRYGEGILKGKRAMLSVMCGGPKEDYLPRGINGPLDELLFPITHGNLFYPGMDVLPTFAVYGTGRLDADGLAAAEEEWRGRLIRLFQDDPSVIAIRTAAIFRTDMSWRIMSPEGKPALPLISKTPRTRLRRCRLTDDQTVTDVAKEAHVPDAAFVRTFCPSRAFYRPTKQDRWQ